jgi:hypothetical protein
MNLIDNPGFNDTNSVFRLFSNSYFYNHIFSKIMAAKFVIVLDHNIIVNKHEDIEKIFK